MQRPQGRQTVTMIPGDGVGPELMSSVKDVFSVAGVPVDFEEMFIRSVLDLNVICGWKSSLKTQSNASRYLVNTNDDLDPSHRKWNN